MKKNQQSHKEISFILIIFILFATFSIGSKFFNLYQCNATNKIVDSVYFTDIALLILFFLIMYYTINRISKYISKNEHLTGILSIIREVNQLIVREKNKQELIQKCCNILISTRVYGNARIVLLNDAGQIEDLATTDTSEDMLAFQKKIKNGWTPPCIQKTIAANQLYSTIENTKQECQECPLINLYEGKSAFNIQLKYKEINYGYITLSIDKKNSNDAEELSLLNEVAGDIAYALYNLQIEQSLKKQADALVYFKELYSNIIDSIDNIIFVKDINFTYLVCNSAFEKFVGKSRNEIIGKSDYEVFEKSVADFFRSYDKKMIAQKKVNSNFEWVTYPDGEMVYLYTVKSPLLDSDGNIIGLVGNSADLTEEKNLEDALQKAQKRFEIAEKIGKVGSWEVTLDMEQFWGSSETKRIYGLPAKSNFFPMEMIETCIPEYERVHRTLVDLLEKGLEYNLEFEIRPYNGTSPKYISSIATVELNEEGHPEKVIGFMQDITERKHSEKELQTSKDKFEKAFNHTPDIIIISHLETGKIYEVNQTFVTTLGYRREEVIGKSVFDINLWPNVNDRKDFAYTLGKNGSIEGKIYSYRTKNGASIIVQIHASLVRIDNEMCILSIAADITGERALEIENQKFINVLDQSINEIHVFNLDDFHFSYVNKASLSALGYAMEEMKALTPVDITKGVRSLEELKQTLKPLIDKEKSRLFMETEHIRKDGTTYPIETQVQIVEFDNIRQVIATSIDISDKIRSRDELKQSQENYKLLAENALDLIWKMNMELEFTYANPSVEMILGYRVEEFVGSKLYDHCSSEEFAKMQTLSLGMLSSNSDQGMSLEAIMHKKDGTEVVLELNGKLIFDDAHNPIGFQGSARDFTAQAEARKKLSDALASLEKKSQELQTILQEAPNPIMLHNEDGEVLMVNKVWETLTGYSYTEINTIEKWAQKACNNKNQLLKENIEKLYSLEQKINMGESTITTKEGNSVIWQFSSAPLGIINGKRTVITSAMDITELKKKDELMMAQSRHAAMGEMIGMIAHQWRQPIAGIAMDANNMLLDIALETFDNTAAEGYAQDILDQTKHLSKTIDDFRNFFKPDKSVSAVKLADIMNETLAIVKESLANNAINLKTSYTSESQVDAYPRELMQVFVNIINNARDALTSDHTKDALIEIKIYDDEEYVNTEICDNGGGIDETILAKLFDPYFSTKDEKTGTGLGLYMSKMIIEEHLHGIIEASNNKDKGACFTVRLLKKNDHNSTLETDDK